MERMISFVDINDDALSFVPISKVRRYCVVPFENGKDGYSVAIDIGAPEGYERCHVTGRFWDQDAATTVLSALVREVMFGSLELIDVPSIALDLNFKEASD